MATAAPLGTPTRVTTDRGRYYITPEGRQLPSVTTILSVIGKPGLEYWKLKTEREAAVRAAQDLVEELEMRQYSSISAGFADSLRARLGREAAYKRVVSAAGDIGTSVHALIEWSLRRELGEAVSARPVSVNERGLMAFMAYEAWRKSVNLKPIAVERMLWSETHGYAGTIDLLAEVTLEGARVTALIDFKTGGVYSEAFLQIAAYSHAAVEQGLTCAPVLGLVVQLPKNRSEARTYSATWDDLQAHFQAFVAAKAMWEWMNRKESR